MNFFEKQKQEARKLPLAELQKHARVSSSHKCGCKNCFCCACLEVLTEIKTEKK